MTLSLGKKGEREKRRNDASCVGTLSDARFSLEKGIERQRPTLGLVPGSPSAMYTVS